MNLIIACKGRLAHEISLAALTAYESRPVDSGSGLVLASKVNRFMSHAHMELIEAYFLSE